MPPPSFIAKLVTLLRLVKLSSGIGEVFTSFREPTRRADQSMSKGLKARGFAVVFHLHNRSGMPASLPLMMLVGFLLLGCLGRAAAERVSETNNWRKLYF
jgi:hypothetical protein